MRKTNQRKSEGGVGVGENRKNKNQKVNKTRGGGGGGGVGGVEGACGGGAGRCVVVVIKMKDYNLITVTSITS